MDEFFQKLREIQKKERNLSGLAPVGENFYQNISKYLNVLMRKIDDNPFSFESYLLRDAQRITAEICERREHKISNSAVMSVQRSYQLFKESGVDSPNPPKIPRNSTPEEEKLFHALIDSLIIYREKMRGPLRFQNSQGKDRSSDIPVEKMDIPGGNSLNEIEDRTGTDTSDKGLGESDSGVGDSNIGLGESDSGVGESNTGLGESDSGVGESNTGLGESDSGVGDSNTGLDETNDTYVDKDNNIGFTPEEEAALEDDIYKQFGRESFHGSGSVKSKEKPGPSRDDVESSKKAVAAHSDNKDIQTDVLLVLEELPSIMGVDKKVYGPLLPQDIVTIPEPNARILIKNQKGKSIQKYK